MPSDSADLSSSHLAAVSASGLDDELPAAMPALAGRSAAGTGDDLITTAVRTSPVTADDLPGKAPSLSGAYIYGFDDAGNPTLTDSGYSGSPAGLPD